jgi:hypothetical protein
LYNEILSGVVSQDFPSHLVRMAAAIDWAAKVGDLAAAGADDQTNAVLRTPRPVVRTGHPATGFLRLVGCFRVHRLSAPLANGGYSSMRFRQN